MKKKHKRIAMFWGVVVIAGIALIVLTDALCEILRDYVGSNTYIIWGSAAVLVALGIFGFRKNLFKLARGQLGA